MYKIVAVDFDGVISHYEGWKGVGVFGPPIKGAKEALLRLKEEGYTIIVFTTRGEEDLVKNYLQLAGIPFDFINENPPWAPENLNKKKPIADVYIDDRAISFKGEWEGVVEKVLSFRPWYNKHKEETFCSTAEISNDQRLYDAVLEEIVESKEEVLSAGKWYDKFMPKLSELLEIDFYFPSLLERCSRSVRELASLVPMEVRKEAFEVFKIKNTERAGTWKQIGAAGAIVEIHAKLSRLKVNPSDKDSMVDLFNYCVFFLACVREGKICPSFGPKKTAVVTGSHKGGLGEIIFKVLSLNGYKVFDLKDVNFSTIENFFDNFPEEKIDVLVNNYGINKLNWIGQIEPEDYRVIDVNLKGPLAVVNELVKRGLGPTRILNVCSQTYRVAQRCTSIYCSSKAGLAHLTRVMARELAPKVYVVNAISPGLIVDTRMSELTNKQVLFLRGWDEEAAEKYALAYIPAGRFTDREEVALAIIKILHLPSYINGTVIDMTGGQ